MVLGWLCAIGLRKRFKIDPDIYGEVLLKITIGGRSKGQSICYYTVITCNAIRCSMQAVRSPAMYSLQSSRFRQHEGSSLSMGGTRELQTA